MMLDFGCLVLRCDERLINVLELDLNFCIEICIENQVLLWLYVCNAVCVLLLTVYAKY